MLLIMTCPLVDGGWLAQELAAEQTLENLAKFSRRLALADAFWKATGKRKEKLRQQFIDAQLEAKEVYYNG